MDTRLLEYFLAIAREGNMTRAAEQLHVTQPTLSKQLAKLEEDLGQELFDRTGRRMDLTQAGLLFRDRAQEIVDLTLKTYQDMQQNLGDIKGEVIIGAAESHGFKEIVNVMTSLRDSHPGIIFEIISSNAIDSLTRLDQGLCDFALVVGGPNIEKYHTLELRTRDRWGVLMHQDMPLANNNFITPDDLANVPIVISQQADKTNELTGWFGKIMDQLNIVGRYNLINNTVFMAQEQYAYIIAFDYLVNTSGNSQLTFIPFSPTLESNLYLVWKRNSVLSPVSEIFIERFREQYN